MRPLALSLLLAAAAAAQTADLAVTNAKIYTVNAAEPQAKAIAVRNGVILAVGADVSRYISPSTTVIDAHGATILPGLIDSHGHVRSLGETLDILDLRGATSEREIVEKVRAASKQLKPGEWIQGGAWDQNLWPNKEFPTAAGISEAAPNNPVALFRVDGHAVWANRKALELADVNAATPDPPGGKIIRGPNRAPAGVLVDRAQGLITRKIPAATPDQVERYLRRATEECARLGITSVHDAGVDAADIAGYRALIRKGQLPIHIYAMLAQSGSGKLLNDWFAKGPETGNLLTVRSIKIVADGALGSRGAAMLEPYTDDPANRGLLIVDRATIRAVAERALAAGFQVNTHAIGDLANRAALDAYGDVLKGINDKRFRIEHAQIIAPSDFAKFKQFSIIASMQATHATSDMLWAGTRIGPERIKNGYAWQTLLHLGVHLPNGSDFPVENPNPLWGFYSAVTRQKQDGTPAGGWFPGQRLSREEALRSWTLEGAYAAFEETHKGSLEPGKVADFIMLSGDIMTLPAAEILKTRVTMTVTDGKIVWRQ